jgi:hypothetical protein
MASEHHVDPELLAELRDSALDLMSEEKSPVIQELVQAMLQVSTDMRNKSFDDWCAERGWDGEDLLDFIVGGIPPDMMDPKTISIGGFMMGVIVGERRSRGTDTVGATGKSTTSRTEHDGATTPRDERSHRGSDSDVGNDG